MQPQCEVYNLVAATVQGQTSGCGAGERPQSELKQGHEREGEERLRGNTTGSLISVAQMSS